MNKNFTPCGTCDCGYIYADNHEVIKCSCLDKFQKDKRLQHLLTKGNVPLYISSNKSLLDYDLNRDYAGKDLNNNLMKVKKFIKNFDSKYSSLNLFFSGLHGTQKSSIARYICRELTKKGKTTYYILADTLIKTIIDSERDIELKELCNYIMDVDFLVIDELSEDKITLFKSEFQIPFLTSFLKTRLEIKRKSTLFCSNSPIDSIGEKLGKAIQDLVFRETYDKSMIFTDNYEKSNTNFDVNALWDD